MHFEPTSVTVRVGHGKSDNLAHACADPKWPRDLQVPGVGGVELPWFTPYLSINIRKYQYEKRKKGKKGRKKGIPIRSCEVVLRLGTRTPAQSGGSC